ncbi:MAG: DUF349 domain-containing protein [Bacteroidetes bacterium]|nr:DUF349 domain-containing protein [Bacteroidota bacterium]
MDNKEHLDQKPEIRPENTENNEQTNSHSEEAAENKEIIPDPSPENIADELPSGEVQPAEENIPIDSVVNDEPVVEVDHEAETIKEAVTEEVEEKPESVDEPEDEPTKKEEPVVALTVTEVKEEEEVKADESADADDHEENVRGIDLTELEDEDSDDDEEEEETEVSEDEVDHTFLPEALAALTREELVEKLEALVTESNVSLIRNKVAGVKVVFLKKSKEEKKAQLDEFLKQGGNAEDFQAAEDPVEMRFNAAFNIYKDNRRTFLEGLEHTKIENLAKKQDILEKLRDLINSEETLKKTYDEFKELQIKWKEIGMVPSGEVSNLWQSYHFLVEKFFDKVKINKELRDLDLKKNLELKVELCEKAEELLLETSIIKSFKQLQKYHDEWKEVGPVPADKRDEIWERFRMATEKINDRRKEYYEKLHEDQEKNLLAKQALCDRIEMVLAAEPVKMKDWQELTDQVDELFKLWKSIGRAPKKHNDEVWARFKASINTFFNNKKEFLNSIKQEQLNNYNLKLDICVQAENLKDSTEWKKTTQDLINLQKDWKKIGPVPKKHSDKIWKRFRAACDEFFNRKSEYFKNIHSTEGDNLKMKMELIEKVKTHAYGDDKSANLEVIKDFQRQFMEIGFVPIKDKERVNRHFREVVNEQLEKLKISAMELDVSDYRNRFENMKEAPEGNRMIKREKTTLSSRISQLREEIMLWENNIGFLANSKKANILKEEFEKKIQKAKEELALMEAKMKMLRD